MTVALQNSFSAQFVCWWTIKAVTWALHWHKYNAIVWDCKLLGQLNSNFTMLNCHLRLSRYSWVVLRWITFFLNCTSKQATEFSLFEERPNLVILSFLNALAVQFLLAPWHQYYRNYQHLIGKKLDKSCTLTPSSLHPPLFTDYRSMRNWTLKQQVEKRSLVSSNETSL